MRDRHIEHNGSGYVDTTVDAVIKREHICKDMENEDTKYHQMYRDIKRILGKYNYVLEGPISLINVDSGRKRRIY